MTPRLGLGLGLRLRPQLAAVASAPTHERPQPSGSRAKCPGPGRRPKEKTKDTKKDFEIHSIHSYHISILFSIRLIYLFFYMKRSFCSIRSRSSTSLSSLFHKHVVFRCEAPAWGPLGRSCPRSKCGAAAGRRCRPWAPPTSRRRRANRLRKALKA